MKRILVFVGTRPEAIKMAPVIAALKARSDFFETRVCSSGQHRELLASALADFEIVPDIVLHVMSDNQTLASLSAKLFSAIDGMLDNERPDVVLVQGDTTTVMVAALCAFYRGIPVGHVEAGLRSHDILSPFPEELNRKVATLTTRWHFAPTALAKQNLVTEGVLDKAIHVTGNPVIDALFFTVEKNRASPPPLDDQLLSVMESDRKIVLVTAHRRENFGAPFDHICSAIARLSVLHPDVAFIYPVHPNPNVRTKALQRLGTISNIHLIEPLSYRSFVSLLERAYLVLSDSGGLQEEAPALGKPILVMRDVTERPEGVEAGVNLLVGSDQDVIVAKANKLLTNIAAYRAMAHRKNPFGDGNAAPLIANILSQALAG
jgi:UDP-N-acetylglucosamine 2-epimerase